MWQKVAKFKGAEYFRKALYIVAQANKREEDEDSRVALQPIMIYNPSQNAVS